MIALSGYAGNSIAVFGLGRSGVSAAQALVLGGAEVSAWDDDPGRRREAAAQDVPLNDLYRIEWEGIRALVLSPGVPLVHPAPHPLVARALTAGIEVLGDMELFARSRPPGRVVGITGTNGKSTTAALTAHLLKAPRRKIRLGGNIGRPVLDLDPVDANGLYVLEISSFQLDLIRTLVSDVAVLLNISPDHIERHGNFGNYIASKTRIFSRRASSQTAVIGIDDDVCRRIHAELSGRRGRKIVSVSVERPVRGGVYVQDAALIDDMEHQAVKVVDLSRVRSLLGAHNWQNAAASYAAVRALGFPGDKLARAFRSFSGLAHRQETVAKIGKVSFVNDSKATNAAAAARGLACYDNIYWIAGGRAKEGGIATLSSYFPRMAHVFLIGESAGAFAQTVEGRVPCTVSVDLGRAVRQAATLASEDRRGNPVVLFSPACASFDQFRDFEDRGDRYRELVLEEKARREAETPAAGSKAPASSRRRATAAKETTDSRSGQTTKPAARSPATRKAASRKTPAKTSAGNEAPASNAAEDKAASRPAPARKSRARTPPKGQGGRA